MKSSVRSTTHSPLTRIQSGEVSPTLALALSLRCLSVEHAEADTFYCFTNLMVHIRENFMRIYDNSEFGILVRMQKFLALLKSTDEEVFNRFDEQKLRPEFYAFRWLTLLLSQEFHLPDVLRIWDSLFANQAEDFEFLFFICCAMVMYVVLTVRQRDESNARLLYLVSSAIDFSTNRHRTTSNCYKCVHCTDLRSICLSLSLFSL